VFDLEFRVFRLSRFRDRPFTHLASGALGRGIVSVIIWLAITGADMIYILSLLWGYVPGLPPDWAMAMLGCAISLPIGGGPLRWTRAAR
jgi:hypothetical protein